MSLDSPRRQILRQMAREIVDTNRKIATMSPAAASLEIGRSAERGLGLAFKYAAAR